MAISGNLAPAMEPRFLAQQCSDFIATGLSMITHFLSEEQVNAYCVDFVSRLIDLEKGIPLLWVTIGKSGTRFSRVMMSILENTTSINNQSGSIHEQKALLEKIRCCSVSYAKAGPQEERASIVFDKNDTKRQAEENLKALLKDYTEDVLIIDSSVYSGSSMFGVMEYIKKLGAKNVISYSLIIKQSSAFVPDFFGLVVGDHDRALFSLASIPNNRLTKPKKTLNCVLRKLTAHDVNKYSKDKEGKDFGLPSITKVTWGDLWYSVRFDDYDVYVLEKESSLIGFVKFKIVHTSTSPYMKIDMLAVEKNSHGTGAGGALMRWAETKARSSSCQEIRLLSIEDKVKMYTKMGFSRTEGDTLDGGDGELFFPMKKALLYHFPLPNLELDQ